MLLPLAIAAWAAEPVLVADVLPQPEAAPEVAAAAPSLRLRLIVALTAADYIPIEREAAAPAVGDALARCAERAGCPADLFPLLPARLAVVARIGGSSLDTALAEVAIYEREDPSPVVTFTVPADASDVEAQTLAQLQEITGLLGPIPEPMLARAVALVTDARTGRGPTTRGPVAAPPAPVRPPTPTPAGSAAPVTAPPVTPAAPVAAPVAAPAAPVAAPANDVDPRPRYTAGVRPFLAKSKLDTETWMALNAPHGGRLLFELRGGVGIGDVNRHLDVAAAVAADATVTTAWQLGPSRGTSGAAMMFVGYAPNAWFDLTLGFGMQVGKADWQVNWVAPDGSEGSGNGTSPLLQPTLSPRIRGWLVPVGPVKPYATVGGDFRFYFQPSVSLKDVPDLDLPVGGSVPGFLAGGGLCFEAAPTVGILLEATWTRHFGPDADVSRSTPAPGAPATPPLGAPAVFQRDTVVASAGLQVRL